MKHTTQLTHILIKLIQAALVIIALILLVRLFIDPTYTKIGGVIASLSLPFLPNVITGIFKFKISTRLQLLYFFFLFVALFLGIDFDWYKTVPYFDKIIHLLSGVLSVILAYCALLFWKATATKKLFQAIFIISFCMLVGVLWEFFEFGCDKLLGQHMQELLRPGVDDTMFDLLSAFIGSIIGTIIILRFPSPIVNFTIDQQKHKR